MNGVDKDGLGAGEADDDKVEDFGDEEAGGRETGGGETGNEGVDKCGLDSLFGFLTTSECVFCLGFCSLEKLVVLLRILLSRAFSNFATLP